VPDPTARGESGRWKVAHANLSVATWYEVPFPSSCTSDSDELDELIVHVKLQVCRRG
jgi:hypothetical protein